MSNTLIRLVAASAFATAAFMPMTISAQSFPQISEAELNAYPTYNGGDLELTVDASGTHFRLWSPGAETVRLNLYATSRNGKPIQTVDMKKAEAGTWTTSFADKLYGKFYTFQVKVKGIWLAETPGAWAKAVGTNGQRAAIIDMAKTNPCGWEKDTYVTTAKQTDAIMYEMHHRDFSAHRNSGITNKGKFLALTEEGTVSVNGQPTGIDHLKQLGITHIHILPSYDYNTVDETQLADRQYNWGYDPLNYNAPEGSYSTNPEDPYARIREMKQMIMALHRAGIGVVMDVVYNHTALGNESNFSLTAPGYYYRHRADGSYSDASGCGNETASDRKQVSDYIVESVKYWATEYHIDGFRFDLMAIHDTETMNRVAEAVRAINPNAVIYGEGWTAGDSPLPVERRALKENVSKMPGIAVFSDDIRDAVKGHYSRAEDCGFASGKPGQEETIKIGVVASTAHPQVDYSKGSNSKFAYASQPTQIMNYVSCHDDLCLTDKLRKSMPEATDSVRMRVARLAQTIVFTSQGTPFMFAGEEIFRDKKGIHNTFKSPDDVNAIDWNLKADNIEQFNYYCNLIALRKAHPAFRLGSAEEVAKNIVFDKVKVDNLVSYSIKNHAGGDEWEEIKVVFNGSDKPQTVNVPKGKWTIIAADGRLDKDGLGESKGGKIEAAPQAALILAK